MQHFQQVRLRGTTTLLSARRPPSWYGHLAVKFQSNRICNVRRDAAIIAYDIDEFNAKLLAVVSGRPNLASSDDIDWKKTIKLYANMAQPFRRQRHGQHHRLRGTAEMPL